MLRSKLFGGAHSSDSSKSKTKKSSSSSISNSISDLASEERFPDSASNRSKETRESADSENDESCVSSANPTKLFSFVKKRNWTGAVKRCKGGDNMKEASTWVVEKHADGKTIWKLLPIHEACENKAPSEVIKALLVAYPESLLLKDSAGDLPLHLACREKSSKAVIAALLSTEPSAAKVKDDEGKLPIHLACRQGVAVQIIDSLIVCHYRGTRTPDVYDLLPLHWACAQNASLAIIESLLRANPDAVDHKDKWERTPLSLANASTNSDKDEIVEALKKDPSFWTTALVDEIDVLKTKLEKSTKGASKVEQLQLENAMLKEKIMEITNGNKFSDEDIEKVAEENSVLGQEVDGMKQRLNEFVAVFRGMEEQRKTLVDLAERMETSILQAVNVTGNENVAWGDPLKSNRKKNRSTGRISEDELSNTGDFSD